MLPITLSDGALSITKTYKVTTNDLQCTGSSPMQPKIWATVPSATVTWRSVPVGSIPFCYKISRNETRNGTRVQKRVVLSHLPLHCDEIQPARFPQIVSHRGLSYRDCLFNQTFEFLSSLTRVLSKSLPEIYTLTGPRKLHSLVLLPNLMFKLGCSFFFYGYFFPFTRRCGIEVQRSKQGLV